MGYLKTGARVVVEICLHAHDYGETFLVPKFKFHITGAWIGH